MVAPGAGPSLVVGLPVVDIGCDLPHPWKLEEYYPPIQICQFDPCIPGRVIREIDDTYEAAEWKEILGYIVRGVDSWGHEGIKGVHQHYDPQGKAEDGGMPVNRRVILN